MADAPLERYLPAARRALARFPVEATRLRPVTISENVSFRVNASDGRDYVLRLHRPGYNSLRELESERLWSAALGDAGLPVQGALATRDGQQFAAVDIPETGEQRYAGMLAWLPGEPLSGYLASCAGSAERCRIFRGIGGLAARLHNQSSRWQAPADFRRPRLDVEGLLGQEPRWGRFWEHAALTGAERRLLLQTRSRLHAVLSDYGTHRGSFSLIHADLHPENLIIQGAALGLIDFDDCAHGWHLYDLASALIEEREARDFEMLREALLLGYREYRDLSADEAALLPLFLLLRGMALIGWFHQRPEHADSDFFEKVKTRVLRESSALVAA
jgi:Ser/Thr protein kinase RdoA (MazF antagonist)